MNDYHPLDEFLEGESEDYRNEIVELYDGSDEEGREVVAEFFRSGGIAAVDAAKARFLREVGNN